MVKATSIKVLVHGLCAFNWGLRNAVFEVKAVGVVPVLANVSFSRKRSLSIDSHIFLAYILYSVKLILLVTNISNKYAPNDPI